MSYFASVIYCLLLLSVHSVDGIVNGLEKPHTYYFMVQTLVIYHTIKDTVLYHSLWQKTSQDVSGFQHFTKYPNCSVLTCWNLLAQCCLQCTNVKTAIPLFTVSILMHLFCNFRLLKRNQITEIADDAFVNLTSLRIM